MLITTCAHCRARFRVTPQQLNAKQGQVRCGSCQKVFNGFEALERFPDDDTGGRLLAAKEAEERAQREAVADVRPLPEDMPEIESIDQAPPVTTAPAVETPQPPAPAVETLHDPVAATEPSRAEAGASRARPRPIQELTLEIEPPEPPSRAWRFGVALAALVLAAELAYAWRAPIAQRYPAVRPALESVCARLDCSVPYSRDEGQLKLEDSELLEVPGKPNEIALGARIRNLASVAQEYPHLELTLTDLTGQAAVRRVLRPTDYLGRPVAAGEVIGPGVEVALQMRLETPGVKATGYELLLFYP